uniref:Myelin basic protein n=1 Tax=Felis catus TaxID=9685 RepID=A0ABI7VTS4_FELCA
VARLRNGGLETLSQVPPGGLGVEGVGLGFRGLAPGKVPREAVRRRPKPASPRRHRLCAPVPARPRPSAWPGGPRAVPEAVRAAGRGRGGRWAGSKGGRVYLARRKPGRRGRGAGCAPGREQPPSVTAARQRGRACGPGGPRLPPRKAAPAAPGPGRPRGGPGQRRDGVGARGAPRPRSGERALLTSAPAQDGKPRGKAGVKRREGPQGEADVEQNNGAPSQDTAVTDSKRTADPKNAWQDANPADPGGRPHLIRLFSRDAPGREDNTFKDRPSESDELQTIQEDSTATPEGLDVMASQKRPSQRHGSKYLASASAMDHARHGFLPRHRDTGILDSLGRFFGGDRGVPKRGSGKVPWLKQRRSPVPSHARSQPGLCNMYQDGHHAARTAHYGSLPQKSQHGRPQDENPVVHFFKNIVTPRTPPPSQGKGRGLSLSRFSWGAEGQKPGFGYGGRAAAHKGFKGADAQGTLSKIFKLTRPSPSLLDGARAASEQPAASICEAARSALCPT